MHVPSVLQSPERQTVVPFAAVHGPSPFAYPHSLSFVSHTALVQTSIPAPALQVPSTVGFMCGGSFGIACPFESVGLQNPADSSHHVPETHWLSIVHATVGVQVPLASQSPERQTTEPFSPVHGPSPFA
jgi:hypothetical protein